MRRDNIMKNEFIKRYMWTNGESYTSHDILKEPTVNDIIYNNSFAKYDLEFYEPMHSKFINYLSNMTNHHGDNLSILTEEEKFDIYKKYHNTDEIYNEPKKK